MMIVCATIVLALHLWILPLQRENAKFFKTSLCVLCFPSCKFSVGDLRIMSRRWIHNLNRCADEYLDGIEDFIEFARRHNSGATRIRCPCRRCNNTLWETMENVGFHLVMNGMIETYSIWNLHGE
ncbi:unnamed protein product [Prunus brigantina]